MQNAVNENNFVAENEYVEMNFIKPPQSINQSHRKSSDDLKLLSNETRKLLEQYKNKKCKYR